MHSLRWEMGEREEEIRREQKQKEKRSCNIRRERRNVDRISLQPETSPFLAPELSFSLLTGNHFITFIITLFSFSFTSRLHIFSLLFLCLSHFFFSLSLCRSHFFLSHPFLGITCNPHPPYHRESFTYSAVVSHQPVSRKESRR